MDTLVSFDIKKLLFNKGWCFKLNSDKTGNKVENSLAEQRWNEGDLSYIDITILEVKMWLYEKNGIWINVNWAFSEKAPSTKVEWTFTISNIGNREKSIELGIKTVWFDSPIKAYEAAIFYILSNLINNQ